MKSNDFIKIRWRTHGFFSRVLGGLIFLIGIVLFLSEPAKDTMEFKVGYYIKATMNTFVGLGIFFFELGAELDLEKKCIREYFFFIVYTFYKPWRRMEEYKFVLIKELERKKYKVFLKVSFQKPGKEILATGSLVQAEELANQIAEKMQLEVKEVLWK
jgi:hypothetical protein